MLELKPSNANELAEALREAAAAHQSIELCGAGSKRRMGGPVAPADVCITTSALQRVLRYDPRDLTLSVEAGMNWAELTNVVARQGQMLPLDPPLAAKATVGGVVAANTCGARRRLFGSARDMVIGMQYAAVDGTLAESGGMVVKNVAGLDVLKALIGSFGTLAAITSVNFKLAPLPEATRTFVLSRKTAGEVCAARDTVLRGVLQPAALDVASPGVAAEDYALLVRAGGSETLLNRYTRELGPCERLEGEAETELWSRLDDFVATPAYTVKVAHPLTGLPAVLESHKGAVLARAGTGITYLGFDTPDALQDWMTRSASTGWSRIVEWGAGDAGERWPGAGPDLDWMRRLKESFDPEGLLNRGRLHGHI